MYVVAATYIVKEGNEAALEEALRVMIPLSRQEPDCQLYTIQKSLDNPRKYLLYEQYTNKEGYLAHRETEHFKKYVLGTAVPLLESRTPEFYEPISEQ